MRTKKAKELWDKLFDLRVGQTVKLIKTTIFETESPKRKYVLPKGTRGTITRYTPHYPFISVKFTHRGKAHSCYLEVNRVKRIDE